MTRIVVADDSIIVREGVARLLETRDDVDVVALCQDYDSLIAAVSEHEPDAVLTDIRMPPTNSDEGIRAAKHFRQDRPDLGVVVLSQYDEPEYALALLEDGSEGRAYLLKERVSNLDQLLAAVAAVTTGGSFIDPKVVDSLVASRSRAERSPLLTLTPREREILSEMAQGKTNAAIAAALFVSEKAVEKHSNAIFSKLGLSAEKDVHRRVKAVLLFLSESA